MMCFARLKHLAALALTLLACLGASSPAHSVDNIAPSSIVFADTSYHLAWHSSPTPDYKKYEFLPQDQQLPYYHNMLMLEHLSNGMDLPQVVQSQLEFLAQRKKIDPVVQHRVMLNEQTGEFLLDFVLSAEDPNQGSIIEWNAYRYVPHQSANGNKGVLLFGYSTRSYGDEEGRTFLIDLKDRRPQDIQTLLQADIPQLSDTTVGR